MAKRFKMEHPSIKNAKEENHVLYPIKVDQGYGQVTYFKTAATARTWLFKALEDFRDADIYHGREIAPGTLQGLEQAAQIAGEPFGSLTVDVCVDPYTGFRFRATILDRRPIRTREASWAR